MEEGTSEHSRSGSANLSQQAEGHSIADKIRKDYLKKRDATKICIYDQFARWRELKDEIHAKTDKEVAAFLLNKHYSSSRETR